MMELGNPHTLSPSTPGIICASWRERLLLGSIFTSPMWLACPIEEWNVARTVLLRCNLSPDNPLAMRNCRIMSFPCDWAWINCWKVRLRLPEEIWTCLRLGILINGYLDTQRTWYGSALGTSRHPSSTSWRGVVCSSYSLPSVHHKEESHVHNG